MTKQDLPFDVKVNGVSYAAGKDVEVAEEHVEAVNEVVETHKAARKFQTTHTGAVKESK